MQHLIEMYLDFFNNYLTIEHYAEHEQLDIEDAKKLITLAKKYYTNNYN